MHTKKYLAREDVAADITKCARILRGRSTPEDVPSGTDAVELYGTLTEPVASQQ